MKDENIKLFNKTIHEIKIIMKDLIDERKIYHTKIKELTTTHDAKIDKIFKEAKDTLNEMYELYDDLTDKTKD